MIVQQWFERTYITKSNGKPRKPAHISFRKRMDLTKHFQCHRLINDIATEIKSATQCVEVRIAADALLLSKDRTGDGVDRGCRCGLLGVEMTDFLTGDLLGA
jgi:hypothetical protein